MKCSPITDYIYIESAFILVLYLRSDIKVRLDFKKNYIRNLRMVFVSIEVFFISTYI